jgi:hypothetical protein
VTLLFRVGVESVKRVVVDDDGEREFRFLQEIAGGEFRVDVSDLYGGEGGETSVAGPLFPPWVSEALPMVTQACAGGDGRQSDPLRAATPNVLRAFPLSPSHFGVYE